MNKDLKKITFSTTARAVDFKDDETILDVALRARVKINHSCGGMGTCGTCRVIVEENCIYLLPRNEIELEMAESRGFEENERLACQTFPISNLKVKIPSS